MALVCNRQTLSAVLRDIVPATVTRTTLPILSNVLINVNRDAGCIYVSATNLEYLITLTMPINEADVPDFVIEAKFLQSWLSNQVTEFVTLDVKDDHVILQSGKSKTKVNILDADEFPKIPEVAQFGMLLPSIDELSNALTQSALGTSSSPSEVRQYTRGVHAAFENQKLSLTAMNGFLLIKRLIDMPEATDLEIGIIPNRCIPILTKLFANSVGDVLLSIEPLKSIEFVFASKSYISARIKTQLIVCPYPDTRRIVPKTYDIMAVFNREEVLRTINMGMLFAVDDINRIYFEFDPYGLFIRAQSSSRGEYENYLTAVTIAGAIGNSFTLNGNSIISWLRSQNTDNIQIECKNGVRNPTILRGAENSENGFMLVQPMITKDD